MVSYFLLPPATERILMISAHIPASGEPGPDEILAALEEAIREDPGLQRARPKMSPATSPAEVILNKSPPQPL